MFHGFDHAKVRPATCKLLDMMDDGLIDARAVADMALSWLSEDSVKQMMLANDIVDSEEDEEDEEESDPMDDVNYVGHPCHY